MLAAGLVLLAVSGCGGPPEVEIQESGRGPVVEWGEPSGDPRGVIILLPGGGWKRPSVTGFDEQKDAAANLRDDGYATVVIRYSGGPRGFHELQRIYDRAGERHPDLPICASGISAGGHLALMLATREPDLACVVVIAGPADLTSLAEQGAALADRDAVEAFGKDGLAAWSPIRDADRIKAKVLMVLAETDPVNPVEQGTELKRVLPSAQLEVLPAGPTLAPLFHGAHLAPDGMNAATQSIVSFLDTSTQGS